MSWWRGGWIVWCWLILVVGGAEATDWPTYRRDAMRSGWTPDRLSAPLQLRWVYQAVQPPELAFPGPGDRVIEGLQLRHRVRFDDVFHVAVVGDSVYFGSSVDHTLRCVDLATGQSRWSYITDGPIRLAPTVVDDRLYVGSDDGYVYCFDANQGELIWKLRAGPRDERVLARGRMTSRWPVRTGVLVDANVAYFGAGVFPHDTVYLCAADAQTGEILWKNDRISQRGADRDDLTPQGYLLANERLLFVPSGRTLPAAFERATGELVHKQPGGGKQVGGSSAQLIDGQVVSLGGEEFVLFLDQSTGGIEDRLQAHQMAVHANQAFLADGQQIVAIDRAHYQQLQQRRQVLETQRFDLQRRLRSNPASQQLARLRTVQAELAEVQKTQAQSPASSSGSLSQPIVSEDVLFLQARVALAVQAYEESRRQYEQQVQQLEQLQHEIDAALDGAVLWRRSLPHESELILAGDHLVAGGVGEVLLLDSETGETIWSQAVDGEVRGLAVADGHLLVSTTDGKIYAFGDATNPLEQAPAMVSNPLTDSISVEDDSNRFAVAAEEILERTKLRRGFALVYGAEEGGLAYELARQSELMVYALEPDLEKVRASRQMLLKAGLYGTRVVVDHWDLAHDPYPNYFANLIVAEQLLTRGELPEAPVEVARHLKPEGGSFCLGGVRSTDSSASEQTLAAIAQWLSATELPKEQLTIDPSENWICATRGSLPGVAYWTHQYGNSMNTACVDDQRIRGGVRILWYGDPGPSAMVNRHQGVTAPLSAQGRLFVQGEESVMAYDAYNGQFLWERKNPGAIRTGVYNNYEPGNLVIGDQWLFLVLQDHCLQMDAATGEEIRRFSIPEAKSHDEFEWGYVAYRNGRLFGTRTRRQLIAEEARRRGRPTETDSSDLVFAIDVATGQVLWSYQGQSVSHTTVAIDDQRVYFVNSSITSEQREQLLRQDKSELARLSGKERELAEERMKRIDAREAVALDIDSGKVLWSLPVDVTDCTGVGIGAGRLTLMATQGYVILCGANANGHYWEQFLAGDFERRRLVVLSAETGKTVWKRDANYRHRPLVVGDRIIAEPWAFYLHTGEQDVRTHPLTGLPSPWMFIRPGHHCGAISATPSTLFFRSGYTAYYDLREDSGTMHFGGHRLGCWINTIPANGLVMIPEASAGCACLFSLTATVVFEPEPQRQEWSVYTARGPTTPVQHMALNLGAPGDRRDSRGRLWLSYPRPASRAGLDLPLEIMPMSMFGSQGTFFHHNSDSQTVTGTDTDWVYCSGMAGITHCQIPVLGRKDAPADYTVRLHFAAPSSDLPGQRVFEVRLQGETVAKNFDIAARAGGPGRAFVLEESGVHVTRDLAIDLLPRTLRPNDRQQPILCGIELLRDGAEEILVKVASEDQDSSGR